VKQLDKPVLSETHFKLLVEKSADMIFRLNEAGDFIYVNPAAAELTGYSVKELLGMNIYQLVKPEKKDSTQKFYAAQLAEKNPASYLELQFVKKDGKTIWIGQHVTVEEGERGMLMAGIARNVSEKIKSEKLQHGKISKLLVLMENLQEGVLVEDEDRKIILANRAFCDLFSVSLIPEDLIGRDYKNALNHIKKLVTDPVKFADFDHIMVSNRNIMIAQSLELKDGRVYERDYVPIYIETGYSGNLWKYRDITEKTRIKSDLIKSERKYKSVIDTLKLGLLEVDTNDRIITANDSFCEILGYRIEDLVGKAAFETLLDEEQQQVMKDQIAARGAGVSNTYEIKIKKADGGYAWMLISGAPMYDHNNNVIGSVGVHLDISYQKQISIELEDKKALKVMMEWQEKHLENLEEKVIERTSEVVKQKEIIEYKNKEITDSINYARRIQNALLPDPYAIKRALEDSFILYKPKDIVSGDFYFFSQSHDRLFIAAADCTGHGVPGAFLSMICSEKLHDVVEKNADTSDILRLLNKGIKASLQQSQDYGTTYDGMDIGICSIDKANRIVRFAGANRPIWIVRKGSKEVEVIKGTKAGIGGFTDYTQQFETHEVKLQEGDSFYVFTDGYADTFNGDTTSPFLNEKLMIRRFKEVLLEIQHLPMPAQSKSLEDFIEKWKSGAEQVDDILVIGIRL
jgi:PAS domain S-box-containing protein